MKLHRLELRRVNLCLLCNTLITLMVFSNLSVAGMVPSEDALQRRTSSTTTAKPGGIMCYKYDQPECDKVMGNTNSTSIEIKDACTRKRQKCKRLCEIVAQHENGTITPVYMRCGDNWATPTSGGECIITRLLDSGYMSCACNQSYCNGAITYRPEEPIPTEPTTLVQTEAEAQNNVVIVLAVVSVVFALVFISIIILIFKYTNVAAFCKRNHSPGLLESGTSSDSQESSSDHKRVPPSDLDINVTLSVPLIKGNFGTISVLTEKVAGHSCVLKTYNRTDDSAWRNEKEIYTQPGIEHQNILQYFGAMENPTAYYIILEYHSNGSLYDYLKGHTLTWRQVLHISLTTVRGIAHLHDMFAVDSCSIKLPIAHRDIKSSNIMLDKDLNAKISDFNLAQILEKRGLSDDPKLRVGTYRYMAPELLCGEISPFREAMLATDVYSMSLVLWEILSRWEHSKLALNPYKLPYEESIGTHPTMDQMKELVSDKKIRPGFSTPISLTHVDRNAAELIATIQAGWEEEWELRLTASCIEHRLEDFQSNNSALSMTECENVINDLYKSNYYTFKHFETSNTEPTSNHIIHFV